MENLNKNYFYSLIDNEIEKLSVNSRFLEMKNFNQHGKTNVYEHSVKVAIMSCKIAQNLKLNVNYEDMIRGALLHDYFLYDWHDKKNGVFLHGFTHPKAAFNNAKMDFKINKVQENIILRHMFPMVPIPPKNIESWVVSLADKISATTEVVEPVKNYLENSLIFASKIIAITKNLIVN